MRQSTAQSRSNSMHFTIMLTSSSRRHSAAQCVHSVAQRLQASIHCMYLLCGITDLFPFWVWLLSKAAIRESVHAT